MRGVSRDGQRGWRGARSEVKRRELIGEPVNKVRGVVD